LRLSTSIKQEYVARGEPVISVDAKKRERIGAFKNAGRKWRPKGERKALAAALAACWRASTPVARRLRTSPSKRSQWRPEEKSSVASPRHSKVT